MSNLSSHKDFYKVDGMKFDIAKLQEIREFYSTEIQELPSNYKEFMQN